MRDGYQAKNHFDCEVGIEMGKETSNGEDVVITTVQSLRTRLDRFDPKVNDHYKKDYGDWHIKIWYSQNFQTEEEALEREKDFLEVKFPAETHKVWLEKALGIKDQNKYSNMSGMTEIRNLTYDEIMETIHQYKQTQSEEEKRLKAILREKHNEK